MNAVALGQVDGRAVIVSGGDDATVRVWYAATGRPVGDPFTGHTDSVRAVALGQVEGRAVIVSGGADATVRVWDAATGRPTSASGVTSWAHTVQPRVIDLAASVTAVSSDGGSGLAVGAELGVLWLFLNPRSALS